MKTRREFLRLALGSIACLGVVIVAPMSFIGKRKDETPILQDGFYFDRDGNHVTSGYAQVGTIHHGNVTVTVTSTDNFESGDAWSVVDARR